MMLIPQQLGSELAITCCVKYDLFRAKDERISQRDGGEVTANASGTVAV